MSIENVVRLPSTATPKQAGGTEFPAVFWDEKTGEAKVFKAAGEVPEGYIPFHPDNAERLAAHKAAHAPKAPEADKPSMSRKAVVKALNRGGIEFDDAASDDDLYALLLAGVKAALAEAKIDHDPDSTDAKALLGLFPSS